MLGTFRISVSALLRTAATRAGIAVFLAPGGTTWHCNGFVGPVTVMEQLSVVPCLSHATGDPSTLGPRARRWPRILRSPASIHLSTSRQRRPSQLQPPL